MTANPNAELQGLLDRFVRVRLVQMGGVDLSVFQFDPFLSWSLFLMNGDKTIYGRFGSASPNTKRDRKDSNPNHTLAGLKAAMREALRLHAAYRKDPETWGGVLAAKTGPKPRWRTAESSPAAEKYGRLKRIRSDEQGGCVHCHEVQRTQIDSYAMTNQRVTDDMLWLYPAPGILGLGLDRDHKARVTRVEPKSIADRAGVKVGDDILTARGQPLISIADLQWVLHTFPDGGGELPIRVRRSVDGARTADVRIDLDLPKLWRRAGDFGWRYRVAGYAMWLWSGATLQDHPRGIRVAQLSPGWFKRPNRNARRVLRRGDLILEVDGMEKMGGKLDRSSYIAYLMRDKKPGSGVRLTIERRGRRIDVQFRLPAEVPEVQGY